MSEKKPIEVTMNLMEMMGKMNLKSPEQISPSSTTSFKILPASKGINALTNFLPLLKNSNPDMAMRISKLLGDIIQYEDEMLKWLSQSEENAKEFALNPINAFKSAVSNLPPGLIEELESINCYLKSFTKEGKI